MRKVNKNNNFIQQLFSSVSIDSDCLQSSDCKRSTPAAPHACCGKRAAKTDLEHGSCIFVYGGSENLYFLKNILICVPKMNEGLMGLERHEGE